MVKTVSHSALIAWWLAVVFTAAHSISILCDTGVVDYGRPAAHNHKHQHHHHGEAAYHHDHGVGNPHTGSQAGAGEACCKDQAEKFGFSLFKKQVKKLSVPAKYYLLEVLACGALPQLYQYHFRKLFHTYDRPPPRAGAGLRVLIQSFLN